jgi:hypothetical protein
MSNIDLIEIRNDGSVQVRRIVKSADLTGWEFERNEIFPGDDYSGEDARVQAICAAVHTPEVIAAYQASRAEPVNEAV